MSFSGSSKIKYCCLLFEVKRLILASSFSCLTVCATVTAWALWPSPDLRKTFLQGSYHHFFFSLKRVAFSSLSAQALGLISSAGTGRVDRVNNTIVTRG